MTRTVALADDAYDSLARLRKPGQSFTDVVRELVAGYRPRLRDVAGLGRQDQAHWESFRRKRSAARQTSRRRANLEDPE